MGHERRPIKIYIYIFERSQKKRQRRKSEREKWAMETEKREQTACNNTKRRLTKI